jgi:hypothetical protein
MTAMFSRYADSVGFILPDSWDVVAFSGQSATRADAADALYRYIRVTIDEATAKSCTTEVPFDMNNITKNTILTGRR